MRQETWLVVGTEVPLLFAAFEDDALGLKFSIVVINVAAEAAEFIVIGAEA